MEETSLFSYLFDDDRCNAECCDFIVLNVKPELLQWLLDSSKEKIECWYDDRSALREGLSLSNTFDNKYNCVELITQSIHADDVCFYDGFDYDYWVKGDLNKSIDNMYKNFLKNILIKLKSETFPNGVLHGELINSGIFTIDYIWTLYKTDVNFSKNFKKIKLFSKK